MCGVKREHYAVVAMAPSRAGSLPQGKVFQCGSEPAREGGLSGDAVYAPGMKCFCAVPRAINREM